MKVLLVEDDVVQRDSLRELLELHGHEVRCATGGLAALSELSVFRAEGVITDLRMPGIGGFAFLEGLRRDHAKLPVVVYTGVRPEDVEEQLLTRLGPDPLLRVVLKPADVGTIEAAFAAMTQPGGGT